MTVGVSDFHSQTPMCPGILHISLTPPPPSPNLAAQKNHFRDLKIDHFRDSQISHFGVPKTDQRRAFTFKIIDFGIPKMVDFKVPKILFL